MGPKCVAFIYEMSQDKFTQEQRYCTETLREPERFTEWLGLKCLLLKNEFVSQRTCTMLGLVAC